MTFLSGICSGSLRASPFKQSGSKQRSLWLRCRFLSSSNVATLTLDTVLSNTNKSRAQQKLASVDPVRDSPNKPKISKAAVLVPLCTVNGQPSILFTLRSRQLSKHRGEVSFPGGKVDKEDVSLIQTALRESHEEIGLDTSKIDVWGGMRPLPDRRGNMTITPILANCGEIDLDQLNHNTDEVAATFHRTIKSLCCSNNTHYTRFSTGLGYTLPVYTGGEHRIWGITAIILHQALTIIGPGLYNFKLRHIS